MPVGEPTSKRWVPRASAEVTAQRPIGVPLPVFFVARMSAAKSGNDREARMRIPGYRCAHPGYTAPIVMTPVIHCRIYLTKIELRHFLEWRGEQNSGR